MNLEITRVLPSPSGTDGMSRSSAKTSGDTANAEPNSSEKSFLETFRDEDSRTRKSSPEVEKHASVAQEDATPEKDVEKRESAEEVALTKVTEDKSAPPEAKAPSTERSDGNRTNPDFPIGSGNGDQIGVSRDREPAESQVFQFTGRKTDSDPADSATVEGNKKSNSASAGSSDNLNAKAPVAPASTPVLETNEPATQVSAIPAGETAEAKPESRVFLAGQLDRQTRASFPNGPDRPPSPPESFPADRKQETTTPAQVQSTKDRSLPVQTSNQAESAPRPKRPLMTFSETAFSAKAVQSTDLQSPIAAKTAGEDSKSLAGSQPISPLSDDVIRNSPDVPDVRASVIAANGRVSEFDGTDNTKSAQFESGGGPTFAQNTAKEGGAMVTPSPQNSAALPSAKETERQSSQALPSNDTLNASVKTVLPELREVRSLRAEIRQLGVTAPPPEPAPFSPKPLVEVQRTSPPIVPLDTGSSDGTKPGAILSTLANTTAPSQSQSLGATRIQQEQLAREVVGSSEGDQASKAEQSSRSNPGNQSGQPQFGLGHSQPATAASLPSSLGTTAIPMPAAKPDKLDMVEELTMGGSASATDSAASKQEVAPPSQRPNATAQAILTQLQAALPKTTGEATEILLNPEELGRVRMTLSGSEGIGTVLLQVERPETLDLIRRNIEQMRAELADAGWDSISFSFSQDGSDAPNSFGENGSSGAHQMMQAQSEDAETAPTPTRRNASASGLDLRL
ncbi:MAG: flagellar hook-length control protein FliK [Pseudomonadota bacterium]